MLNCENINSLEQIQFIAGGTQVFEYTIYNAETGDPIDISTLNFSLIINSLSNPDEENALVVPGVRKTSDTFIVTLTDEQTQNLKGVYTQQPVLQDIVGNTIYKPSQGIITITQSNN